MIDLEAKARETAEEIEELYWTEAERLRIEKNRKELKQIILSALEAVVKEKDEALKQAVEVIKEWHKADDVWQIYYNNAPEMRLIRESLATESRPTK